MIKTKRAYAVASKSDGYRILVDRLWPRGISKDEAAIHLWLKEIAPSDKLRKWFSHDAKKWNEFKRRYHAEIKDRKELLDMIKDVEQKNPCVTLVYAAKDVEHNNAVVLAEILEKL